MGFVAHAKGHLHAIVGCLVSAMGHIVMILVNNYGPSFVAFKYLVYIPASQRCGYSLQNYSPRVRGFIHTDPKTRDRNFSNTDPCPALVVGFALDANKTCHATAISILEGQAKENATMPFRAYYTLKDVTRGCKDAVDLT